jgi:zinc protease
MTRLLAALSALALMLPGTALAQAPKGKPFFPYPLQTTVLPNGLSITRVPFKSPGLVSYYSVVRVGSRNEVEADHSGFAHFFEHMMFRGTKAYPGNSRESLLGKLGFKGNAFTTSDVTVYHVTGPSSALDRVVEVEADRFRNLEYDEAAFQTEAKAVLGEYHKNAASPDLLMFEKLSETAFTKHTYRHTTLGFYEDIKKMPTYFEYSKQFFQRWYTPDNVMVFVVGEFDDAALMKAVQAHYGPWKGKSARTQIPVEPPQKSERTVHIDWPRPTLPRHLHAWHTPASSLKNPDAAVMNVLSAYLAGPTSPLYKDLVLERQLVESVGGDGSPNRDPSLFSLEATLKDEAHRSEVKTAFDFAVAEVTMGKVDPKRVQDIKDHLRYRLQMGLETTDQVAGHLSVSAGILGAPDAVDQMYRWLDKVKPADLSAFARKHLTSSNRTVLTLSSKPAAAAPEGGAK